MQHTKQIIDGEVEDSHFAALYTQNIDFVIYTDNRLK
jgi:hypothetical protein